MFFNVCCDWTKKERSLRCSFETDLQLNVQRSLKTYDVTILKLSFLFFLFSKRIITLRQQKYVLIKLYFGRLKNVSFHIRIWHFLLSFLHKSSFFFVLDLQTNSRIGCFGLRIQPVLAYDSADPKNIAHVK